MMSESDLAVQAEKILERAKHELLALVHSLPAKAEAPAVESPTQPEPLVDAKTAAAHLGVSERYLRNRVAALAVPHYRPGGDGPPRFKLSELDDWSRVNPPVLRKVS